MFERDPKTAEMGREILPFQMGHLPEFFQKKAEVELRDTPENRQLGMKTLKDMMACDKHFNGQSFDEDFLIQFLRCRKFNVNRAFSQLKAFVNLRRKYHSIFRNFSFENISISTKNKILTFLPYRCQDGCAIILAHLDRWDPEELPAEDVKRTLVLFFLQSLRDPMTQVNGFKVIIDVKTDNPFRYIKHVTPSNMYLMYYGTQECVPGRFKGIHIVNNSLILKIAWTLVKSFLSSKLKRRIHFHDSNETLLDFFPASVLPQQYGGELEEYDSTGWLRGVMSPDKLTTLGGGTK